MQKSILIEILSKFSSKELKEFGEYVRSPFFNKNESVIKLYDYLRKQYPDFAVDKVQKNFVYGKIFPSIEYNDGFIRTLMFELSALAEDFLSYIDYKSSYFADKQFLLYELNNRQLDRLFEKNMKIVSRKLNELEIKDTDYFYNKYTIDYENFFYLGRTKLDKTEKIVKKSDVEDMFNNLTYFYLMNTMKLYMYSLNVMELYNFRFDTEMMEDAIKVLKAEQYNDIPMVSISYHILMLFLKENDTSYFYKTKDLVQKFENKLDEGQLHNTYTNLHNYCRRMIRKGRTEFLDEVFDLYNLEIKKKLYPLHNEMSFRFFTNVVETALKLKKYRWTKDFIEKYKNELPPASMENSYNYTLALFEFETKNFVKSLEILSKVKYNDVFHKIKYRCLLLMLYYELDYGDMLFSHMDAFNHFLINDTLISYDRKKYYSSFLKHVKYLYNSKKKKNPVPLYNIKQKITEERGGFSREWLMEKIDELMD